jgi:hypothetical protein
MIMVVFVDVNTRQILIYDENGVRKIPFHDAHILTDIVGNKKINYVTNVMETQASDVVDLVRGISGQRPLANNQKVVAPDLAENVKEASYLHSKSNGTLLIPDMDDKPAPGEKGHVRQALIRFNGTGDCKLFDDDMKEKIKKSPLLRSLIKKGTIEMVGEQRKNELLALSREQMKKTLSQQSARDAALSGIIMDGRVEDWDGGIAEGDTAIEIDVGRRGIGGGGTGAGSPSHGASSMAELESMINGTM